MPHTDEATGPDLPSLRACVVGAFGDVRRHWKDLLAYELLVLLARVLLISPLASLVLLALRGLYGQWVLTDQQIAAYAISLPGLASIAFAGTLAFCLLYAECAGILIMAHRIRSDASPRPLRALESVARRLPAFLLIGARQFGILVLWALPGLAMVGVLAWRLLTRYDINYYLARKPPAFVLVLILAGLMAVTYAYVAVRLLAFWIFTVPEQLARGLGVKASHAGSRALVRGHSREIATAVAACIAVFAGVVAVVTAMVGLPAAFALSTGGPGILLLAALAGLTVLVADAARLLGMPVLGSLIYRLYVRERERAGDPLPAAAPEVFAQPAQPKRRLYAVVLLGLLAASALLILGTNVGVLWRAPRRVVVAGHRGSPRKAPENTLSSMRQAAADGADYAELDVREAADGVIVVHHDQDLMRLAGRPDKVWDLTSAELAKVDIGSTFSDEFGGEGIPTLAQAIEAVRGRAGLCIELKMDGRRGELVRRTVETVRRADFVDECIIISLDYDAIAEVRELEPGLRTGFLVARAVGNLAAVPCEVIGVQTDICTPDFVRRAHEAGKRVAVWTVDHDGDMDRFIDMGVDCVITNRPDVLAQKVNAYLRMSNEARRVRRLDRWLNEHL
jgi:glycerophosphoryl diester phosphodiesterase